MSAIPKTKNAPVLGQDESFAKKEAPFSFARAFREDEALRMELNSYHDQNQTFLERTSIQREKLTAEEIALRERQKLITAPAHQYAEEGKRSQKQPNNITPAFVFR